MAKLDRNSHLYSAVRLQKQVPAADAAVDAAQSHVEAEGEEVAMVEVAHAVVQPGWGTHSGQRAESGKLQNTEAQVVLWPIMRLFFKKGYDSDGPSSKHTCNMTENN